MEKLLPSVSDIMKSGELGIYDHIIVGSRIGGGILSEDLARRKKKVLLIERGGATFSTHICNTARPHFARCKDDSPEDNETVYNTVKSLAQTTKDSEKYVGGPLYCIGGRSIVWGLWIPRTDDKTLKDHFHPDVAKELRDKWFKEAFDLVTNHSQDEELRLVVSKKDLSDAIKIAGDHKVAVGPIATQLNPPPPPRALSLPTGRVQHRYPAPQSHL